MTTPEKARTEQTKPQDSRQAAGTDEFMAAFMQSARILSTNEARRKEVQKLLV
jgi:hypothetical protein